MGRRIFSFATSSVAVFVLAWAAVLSVPELRHLAQQQLDGVRDHDRNYGSTSTRFTPLAPIAHLLEPKPPTLPELAARHPDDIGLQLLAREEQLKQEIPSPDAARDFSQFGLRAYEVTLARNPRQAWLLAGRLRAAMSTPLLQLRAIPEPGWPKDPQLQPKPQERTLWRKLAFDSIAVAQRGQKIEPDNCYFDWALASFLFALERDEEALQALHRGALKPRYDDHVKEEIQARFEVQNLMRKPLFEEKIAMLADIMIAHYGAFRQVARITVAKGAARERAGDHAKALQIYGDLAALGARMRDSNYGTYITDAVARAIQAIAWRRGREWTPEEKRQLAAAGNNWGDISFALVAARFVRYSESHGRPDLARQARHNSEINNRLRLQFLQRVKDSPYNIPIALWKRTVTPRWVGATLMSQIQTLIVVWLAFTIGLLGLRLNRARLRARMSTHVAEIAKLAAPKTPQKKTTPSSLDVASVVLWSGCVMAVLLVLMLRWGAEQNLFDDSQEQMLLPGRPQSSINIVSGSLVEAPVALCALHIWLVSTWRVRRRLRALRLAKTLMPFDETSARNAKPSVRRQLLDGATIIVSWCLLFAVVGTWISFFNIDMATLQPFDYSYPIFASLLAALWSIIKWRWSDAPVRPDIIGNARWYASSLGILIALSSVTYAAFAFASLPARQLANARVDDYIQRGEMALIRETQLPAP